MKGTFLRSAANAELESRGGAAILLLILLLVGVRSVFAAVEKPFWFDELCTVIVSRLPSAAGISEALRQGANPQPPAYYIAEHLARQLVPYDHLGYRVLSILGALMTIACVYFILSRRVSRSSALVGASFVLCTAVAGYYATEARPYALGVGCFSAAILAWQRIDDSRLYAIATAVALAAAASLHYYAIFVWPAFLAAELSIWVFKRRFRVSAWAAIVAGALPMAFVTSLMLQQRQYYGTHLWAMPSFNVALFAHDLLFDAKGRWGPLTAVGLTVLLLWLNTGERVERGLPGERSASSACVPAEELILTLMLLWLPLVVFAAAKIAHGGMLERYSMPAILGGALALGYVVDRAPVAGRYLLLLLFLLGYAAISVDYLKDALHRSLLAQRAEAANELDAIAEQARKPALPIVISDEDSFVSMAYYTLDSSRSRMYFIADPASAVTYSKLKTDTVDRNMLALRRYFPLQVEDYATFLSTHREFILVTYYGNLDFEWLSYRLVHDGYAPVLISSSPDQDYEVFDVTVKP